MVNNDLEFREFIFDDSMYHLLLAIKRFQDEESFEIKFNQAEFMKSDDYKKDTKLQSLNLKYNGLCEIVSNCVIAEDLLGSDDKIWQNLLAELAEHPANATADDGIGLLLNSVRYCTNPHKKKITLSRIKNYQDTHMLEHVSFFQYILAYFFNIYPLSLFSSSDELLTKIDKKANRDVLQPKFQNLKDGEYVKFYAFEKKYLFLKGHAMVIKKTKDLL